MRAFVLAALVAGPVWAAPEGCYTRHYGESHLARHPEQVVANIWVNIREDAEQDATVAGLGVTTTNAGHVKGSDLAERYFDQGLTCFEDSAGRFGCAVDCDGGSFMVVRDTYESIDIRTEGLWVGDTEGCGGAVNIAERPDGPTTYRLFKSAPEGCVVN